MNDLILNLDLPRIIPRDRWCNPDQKFSDIDEAVVVNSIVVDAFRALSARIWQPPEKVVSNVCSIFGIDLTAISARGFSHWTLFIRTEIRLEDPLQDVFNSSSVSPGFIHHVRAELLGREDVAEKISGVANNARKYHIGRKALGRRFAKLRDELSIPIDMLWLREAAKAKIQALEFSSFRTRLDGNAHSEKEIEIKFRRDRVPPGRLQSPHLIPATIVERCLEERPTDSYDKNGFALTFSSENPMLEGTTAELSICKPRQVPRGHIPGG